jgi:hypothetical protein
MKHGLYDLGLVDGKLSLKNVRGNSKKQNEAYGNWEKILNRPKYA